MTDLSGLLLPLLLLLLVGFMFWSQRRRQRAALELQAGLEVGSEVCTTSGLYGVITALDDTVAHLQVAPGTVVKFDRRAVVLAVPTLPTLPTSPTSPTSPTDEK